MDDFVNFTLRSFFASRRDLFGDKSAFLRFESESNFCSTDGLNSEFVFGRIVYEKNGYVSSSTPLALKLSPEIVSYRGFYLMHSFFNEIFFYSKVVPFFTPFRQLDHLFPCFYTSHVEISQNLQRMALVHENLQATGYRGARQKAFLDYDHLALMMRKLGEFHAYSYMAKTKVPRYFRTLMDSFKDVHFTVTNDMQFLLPFSGPRGMRPLRSHPKYSARLACVEKVTARANEFMVEILTSEKDHPMSVLCHGDYLRNNVLFKYDRNSGPVDMKLLDMANCRLASPVVDLALVLYINADQRMRDEHWDDLIDEYYAALSSTFPLCKVPTKEQIMDEFKIKSLNAYFVASYFLPALLAEDFNLATANELLPEEYRKCLPHEVPQEINLTTLDKLGGSIALEALGDILKDMIDRGFI